MKSLQKSGHLAAIPSRWDYLCRLSSKLKPEVVFLYFASVLGFSLLVIVPPFQSPDAQHHFFRAYQVSEGIMIGKQYRVESLPKSLKQTWEVASRGLPLRPDRKITPANILSAFQYPLDSDDRCVTASNAAVYSPHFYFPQAIGILVGRKLGLGPLALYYLGSLCTLVVCIFLSYWSIRKTPVLKWAFCLFAAIPVNIALAASCSQDAIISGFAFLFTASVLDLALSPKKKFTVRSVLLPATVGALLAPAKAGAYAPMLAFFLFVPARKAASLAKYVGLVALAVTPAVVALASWTIASQHQLFPVLHLASSDLGAAGGNALLWGIWQDPLQYLWLLIETATVLCKAYVAQYIGVLGWEDTLLPRPLIVTYLVLLIATAAFNDSREGRIGIHTKIIAGFVVVFVYIYIHTTQYCVATPSGSTIICGFLGRYLIPLSPAFFLLFCGRIQILRPGFTSLLHLVTALFMVAVIPITLLTVINRYYGEEPPTWRMFLDMRVAPDSRLRVEITPSDNFYQAFVCPLEGLTGVSVRPVDSRLPPGKTMTGYQLVLMDAVSGDVVREVGIPAFTMMNRGYLDILFDPILDSKNRKYVFTIRSTDKAGKIPIALALSDTRVYPEGETTVEGRKIDRSVVFELIFKSSLGSGK